MTPPEDRKDREDRNKLAFNWKRILPFLVIAILIFIISTAMSFSRQGFRPTWGDETFTLRLADGSFQEFMNEILSDVHPPLYFALNALLGSDACPGEGVVTIRLIAFVLHVFFLLGLLFITWRVLNKPGTSPGTFNWSALILLSSAHLALFGPMMRYYLLSALFVWASTGFLLDESKHWLLPNKVSDRQRAVNYGIFTWLALATSYLTLVIIPAHIIYLLTRPKSMQRPFRIALFCVFIAYIPIIFLLYLQIQGIDGSSFHGLGAFIIGAVARSGFTIYSFLVGEFVRPWDWWLSIPAFISFIYLILHAWKLRTTSFGSLFWLMMTISLPLGVLALSWIGVGLEFSASRLFFLAPMFLILLGKAPSAWKYTKTRINPGTIAVIVLVVVNLISTYNYSRGTHFIQSTYVIPWEEIAGDIKDLSKESTLILYDDDTLQYWLSDDTPYQEKANLFSLMNQDYRTSTGMGNARPQQVIAVFSLRNFSEDDIINIIENIYENDYVLETSVDYLREDETSIRFKSMLLGRQVHAVKRKLIVLDAAG